MFETDYGVIVACDVKTLETLKSLVESTAQVRGIVGYKVGFILGLSYSLAEVVETIKDITDLPVIYDHQKASTDIPEMGIEFATVMKNSGIDSGIVEKIKQDFDNSMYPQTGKRIHFLSY